MPPTSLTLFDYLKAQEVLLQHEKRLAEVAQQVAEGKLPIAALDEALAVAEGQRELVRAVLAKVMADRKRP